MEVAANNVPVDAAVEAVLSKPNGILHWKQEQGTAVNACLVGAGFTQLLPTGFGENLVEHNTKSHAVTNSPNSQ